MTGPRDPVLADFLACAGWESASVRPLAGDASNRRYLRLSQDSERAVLMDAPPERGEDVRPFMQVTEWLREAGCSAPAILAADAVEGFLLLEDLGDDLFARYLERTPDAETQLYGAAVDLLVELSARPAPDWASPYDTAVLEREALLFVDWWLPAASKPLAPAERDHFVAMIQQATECAADCRDILVQRDYHAENLIWLPERHGDARVGLLDYQDALAGHPAYDLVSLLEDARRDTSPDLQDAMIARYLAARPLLDPAAFRRAYAALGAQRNLKIIGIFARLAKRDGKPRYLDLIPRVWRHLLRDLAHPNLADLRQWVEVHAPEPDDALLDRIAKAGAA